MNREQRRARERAERRAAQRPPDRITAMLRTGLEFHQAGDLADAENVYRLVLATHPEHPDALHLLGELSQRQGKPDLAFTLVRRAIRANPDVPAFHATLGELLRAAGRFDEAEASYRHALELDPGHIPSLNNLGNVLRDQGRIDEAVECFRTAIRLDPRHPGAHNNLGIALERQGFEEEALAEFRKALEIDPNNREAQNNLGNALQAKGEKEEALANLRKAVALDPDNVVMINNLAVALAENNQDEEAITWYRRGLELEPDAVTTLLNLGATLRKVNRAEEALPLHERAYELEPENPNVVIALGSCLRDLSRPVEAIGYFQEVIDAYPEIAAAWANSAHCYMLAGLLDEGIARYERAVELSGGELLGLEFSLGWALVGRGRLGEGWDLFDHRFDDPTKEKRGFEGVEPWEGQDLTGKRLHIWREQGIGDEILYATAYHDVIAQAEHVSIECEPRLNGLFARSFPSATVLPLVADAEGKATYPEPPENTDYHVPNGSLFRFVRRRIEDYPPRNAYLVPDPDRVAFWKARLARRGPGLRVGFSWRSKITTGSRGRWYTSIEQWGPIFAVEGVHWVNLQYDDCSEELRDAEERFGIEVIGWDDIDLMRDMDNIAALNAALDLVIGPGNAVTALSGTLGVPTWQFDVPDDYASLGSASYPWLPSLRRFTREHTDTWDDVIDRIAESLAFVVRRSAAREAG